MRTSTNPKVSIGLPVYNGENYVANAFESILNQTFTDFELVVSDNGSTDGTQSICEAYAQRDSRVRYHRFEANAGAAWNFNRAFYLSRGKYFKWAAHDDTLAPTYFETLVPVLDQHPATVLAYTRALLIDENDEVNGLLEDNLDRRQPRPSDRIRDYDPGACNPVFGLIRRDALNRTPLIGPFPSSDVILLWRLLLLGQFQEDPNILFLRRSHPSSSVRANPDFQSRMAWFAPGRAAKLYLPAANRVGRYLQAIDQTDMPRDEKLRCYLVVARRFLLHPRWIYRDFSIAIQEMMGDSPMKRESLI